MNLTDLNFAAIADEGAVMTVMHPVNAVPLMASDNEPVTIQLYGIDSDVYTSAIHKNRDDNVDEMRRRAKFSSASDDFKGAKLLARCTIAWHGIPQGWVDGSKDEKPAVCNYENAVKLYTNRGVKWLREQVDTFIADRANFLQASSKT